MMGANFTAHDRPPLLPLYRLLFRPRGYLCLVLRPRTLSSSPMETLLVALLAFACLAYLVAAVLRPEKF